ncbi:hypothetical protein [Lewinella sp. W8]|nr:hypothetical protein [Lewinella sp. W8]MTB51663.1 hypothetical protein [Lewinella sp. W8]
MIYFLLLLPVLAVPVASAALSLPSFDFDLSADNDFYRSVIEELESR